MAFIDIDIEDIKKAARVFGQAGKGETVRDLKEAIDDIADEIERLAKENAPIDKDPDAYTWRNRPGPELKDHPVDRTDARSIRGSGLGVKVAAAEITVARHPYYAIFVHEGTAPHVAKTEKGMRFKTFGKWVKTDLVRGQEAQPFLRDAYEEAAATYVPFRVAQLKAEIGLNVLGPNLKVASVGRFGTRVRGPGGRFVKVK